MATMLALILLQVQLAGPHRLYPDAAHSGVMNPAVTQENIATTVCRSGWTKTVRPAASFTNALKSRQLAALHLPGRARDYEEDHYLPLELGGCPDCEGNLWPEPWPDARLKDVVETHLHREVCAGRLPLLEAQKMITTDWYAVYLRLKRGKR